MPILPILCVRQNPESGIFVFQFETDRFCDMTVCLVKFNGRRTRT